MLELRLNSKDTGFFLKKKKKSLQGIEKERKDVFHFIIKTAILEEK